MKLATLLLAAALVAVLCACPSPHPRPKDGGADAGGDGGTFDAGQLPPAACPASPEDGGCPAGMPWCSSTSDELCSCALDPDGGPGSCPDGTACISAPNYRDPEYGPPTLDVCADVCPASCDPGESCSGYPGACACSSTQSSDTCSNNALLDHCGSDHRCGGLFARCDTAGAAGMCRAGLTCEGPFQINGATVNECLQACSDSSNCAPWMSCQPSPLPTAGDACLPTACGPGQNGAPGNGELFGDCSSTGPGGANDGTCVPFAVPPNTCVKDGTAPWFSPCYPTSLYALGHAGRDDPGALCAHGSICVPYVSATTGARTGLALCLPLCRLDGADPKCPGGSLCEPMEPSSQAIEGVCVHP